LEHNIILLTSGIAADLNDARLVQAAKIRLRVGRRRRIKQQPGQGSKSPYTYFLHPKPPWLVGDRAYGLEIAD
jgi:hypothetical protein